MAEINFRYPGGVASEDRLSQQDVAVGLEFLELLWTPDELPRVAGPYSEYKYPDAEVFEFNGLTGVEALIAYRKQFGDIVDGEFVGPRLVGYDVIGVPVSRTFDALRNTDAARERGARVGGMLFRSYFNLPASRPTPEGLPPISLIMEEHFVFSAAGKVVGRMYLPRDEHGPMGRGTDRPDINQHGMVPRQIDNYVTTGEALPLPTAEEAFRAAYPDIGFEAPATT